MSNDFEPLRADEVLSVENDLKILVGHPTFKVNELKQILINNLQDYDSALFRKGNTDENLPGIFTDGINAQVLKYGANGWQEGKIRIQISLEFCPDEPEDEEIPASNKWESSEPESPLDDIRRMQE
ncbi:KGK domain-containing protein [Laspinema olomoucense]|uniref:KGK domain-containing protein n=1 Tax=Laspinema olomoucense TaxID=3231600 RepID=UPI0021BA56A6|nr:MULTISPECIES: KGK domain-containing protein [unclassified Laspinema]MCT7989676.1 hypothetical protein [Laspinema sp. D3a]MCT7993323.1 hypothetical protein [Laspinema sp. D3c]